MAADTGANAARCRPLTVSLSSSAHQSRPESSVRRPRHHGRRTPRSTRGEFFSLSTQRHSPRGPTAATLTCEHRCIIGLRTTRRLNAGFRRRASGTCSACMVTRVARIGRLDYTCSSHSSHRRPVNLTDRYAELSRFTRLYATLPGTLVSRSLPFAVLRRPLPGSHAWCLAGGQIVSHLTSFSTIRRSAHCAAALTFNSLTVRV